MVWAPNADRETSSVSVGESLIWSASLVVIKDRWAPSSKRMLASQRVCPALTGATVVFKRDMYFVDGEFVEGTRVA